MKCILCKEKPVVLTPCYCKDHFLEYFEKKVQKTINDFKLFSKKDKICVGVSGGKDSSSLLYLLHKLGYNVHGLAIDEGIKNYRDNTLLDLKRICKKYKINLKIVKFNDFFGITLDKLVLKEKRPCSACGILRRRLLNFYSKNFDVIATGHNLDDEAQAILMNLLKGNIELLRRLGPVTGSKKNEKVKGFTKRVKPLYFCTEKECLIYSYLNKLEIRYNECPYVYNSLRSKIRDYLNELESKKKGTKENIVRWFLRLKFKKREIGMRYCKICNEPSTNDVCNVCSYIEKNLETINKGIIKR